MLFSLHSLCLVILSAWSGSPSGRQAYEGSPFNKCVIQAIKDGVILRDMQQKVVDGK